MRERINRRVTGDPARWPLLWLRDLVPDRVPFDRALSIGCGVGNLERSLAEFDLAHAIVGIDESAEAVREARRRAAEGGWSDRIDYEVGDARSHLASSRRWDAVFFHAALHHFDRLPELLGLVRGALRPGGILYVDEYIGPAREEWKARHVLRWNWTYRRLPPGVRRTHVIRRPINKDDPTEAIASSGIVLAIEEHFGVLARRDYGGNLLAPIYPSLRRPDEPGGPDRSVFDSVVRELLGREERLMKKQGSFYAVIVAERSRAARE